MSDTRKNYTTPASNSSAISARSDVDRLTLRYDGADIDDPNLHYFELLDAEGNGTEIYSWKHDSAKWSADELAAYYAQFIEAFRFKGTVYDLRGRRC